MTSAIPRLKRRLAVAAASACLLLPACEQPTEVKSGGRVVRLSNDRHNLQLLYRDTKGADWHDATHWMSDNPIWQWYGVAVRGLGDQSVSSLYLNDNNLQGGFPGSALRMRRLVQLHLHGNRLTGPLPIFGWDHLPDLRSMNLSENQLGGPIPSELGQLETLQWLDLANNQFSGPIPPELGNLTKLYLLSLWETNLTGPIPTELGDLGSLIHLYLINNDLTGPIPASLGNLERLEVLRLDGNRLSGSIPKELGRLRNLSLLALYQNSLTGAIPGELGDIEGLDTLVVLGNDLTGPIPPELGRLSELDWLSVGWNPGLAGPLPMELTNLPLSLFVWSNTGLCAPRDSVFQAWLATIESHIGGPMCP